MSTAVAANAAAAAAAGDVVIAVVVPWLGFDPTEVAVPIHVLLSCGTPNVRVEVIAVGERPTPQTTAAAADPIMITGVGLYALKWTMRADPNGLAAYAQLEERGLLKEPNLKQLTAGFPTEPYAALLLPGGHCKDMRPYLEDIHLHDFVRRFAATGKPIAAVCHGVVAAARSGILTSKRVTALPAWMEHLAHTSTRLWMGSYYRTYEDRTVESEVKKVHQITFERGPMGLTRDSPSDVRAGFVVRDGTLLTARWPGDTHRLGYELLDLLGAFSPEGRARFAAAVKPRPNAIARLFGSR